MLHTTLQIMLHHLWKSPVSLILLLLSVNLTGHSLSLLDFSNSSKHLCSRDEMLALLDFKNSFTINALASEDCSNQDTYFITGGSGQVPKAKTKSWNLENDCCEWDGVTCHPSTGHVIGLDLSCAQLNGTIGPNSTLFQLRHLKTLDLAFNFFYGSYVSPQFGNFLHLTHLNLSDSNFQGAVSSKIGHLQQLASLDLSSNGLDMSNFKVIVENLTALTHINLDDVNIGTDIPLSLVNRSSLTYLSLFDCSLQGKLPSEILSLPRLQVLKVGYNIDLHIDMELGNWSKSLDILDLTFLNISKQLPYFLNQSKPLRKLSLHGCRLYGTIPPWVWNISEVIELGDNHLVGSFPSNKLFNNLPSLVTLDLSSNNFSGIVDLSMFSESKYLRILYLSNSGLSVISSRSHTLNSSFLPKLEMLMLSSCNISEFPSLSAPEYLWWLDLSNNNIHGEIPKWLHGMGQVVNANEDRSMTLNLSRNSLTCGLENLPWKKLSSLDLSSNMLQGSLPNFPNNLVIDELNASNNKLNGTINPSICNLSQIGVLDLSNNTLAGEIPLCLGNSSYFLAVLNLQSNRLTGTLPLNFTKCNFLACLDLSDNQLEGVVPDSLSRCQYLNVLNLGNNKFEGAFPSSLDSLPRLQVLNLRVNNFHGPLVSVSKVKHPFSKLQIFDISNNEFYGKLPLRYIDNFATMMNMNESSLGNPQYMGARGYTYSYSIDLTFKGQQQLYTKIITTMSTLDMSNNKFKGEIPNSIGKLHSLRGLNLSHNLLTGSIPPSIGMLSLLDCLDLSSNRLIGYIPQELTSLTFLEVFNVSMNLLKGPIPHGNNFNTFSADSYKDNLGLCGQPLLECGVSRVPSINNTGDDEDLSNDDENTLSMWEVVMMGFGSGVVVGLAWGYYMLSVGNPFWFIKLAYKMELALLGFWDQQFGRRGRTAKPIRK